MASIQSARTLAELLDSETTLPWPDAVGIVRSIAVQVVELHSARRAHGEIGCETISLDAAGRPSLLTRPGNSSLPNTRRSAERTPLGKRPKLPDVLIARIVPQDHSASQRMSDPADGNSVQASGSTESDVFALAALLCRLVTSHPADDYLCSPRVKALVPDPLQPLLDRILGSRAEAPIADAAAFLTALDEAVLGQPHERALVAASPSGERESAFAADVETVEIDSECVSGIVVDPAGGLPAGTSADGAELPFRKLGHYEIVGRLGQGGMGEVYLGYERGLDRKVAIKVLPSRFSCDRELVRRFQAEATAAARLIHSNIIQIYYIGEDAGHHFFAMQYVAGITLSRLLSKHRLTIDQAVAISEEVLSGLAAAHKLSLVHRDIKPSNILLDTEHRRALLADFGLVKSLEDAVREQTATGVVMGTADYMSPEQALGQPVDCRSDLYATGIVMYQMLCGRLPFMARESSAVIYHHVHVPPPPIVKIAPHVSAPLAAFVAKLLAKSPGDRYQSANEALADLRTIRAGHPISDTGIGIASDFSSTSEIARPSPRGDSVSAVTASSPAAQAVPSNINVGRRRILALAFAGTAVFAAIVLGVWHVARTPDTAGGHGSAGNNSSGRGPAVIRSFRDSPADVNCFAVTSDERKLIAGARSDHVVLWDFQTCELGRTIRAHSGPLRRVIFSSDDKFAITASADQTLKLWNATTWKQITQFNGHVDVVTSVVQVPGRDEIVSSSFDGRLCRWSLETGDAIAWYGKDPIDPQEDPQPGPTNPQTQDRHVAWVRELLIPAPGNRIISAGNDRVILIWDVDSAEVVGRLIEHKGPVMCLAASHDGTRLLSGGFDKSLCLWNIPEQRLIHRIPHKSATAACVAFSPDGRSAVSGGADGLIHVWDVETGAERTTWEAHLGTVTSIRFTADGRQLISGGEDRTVRVWKFPADAS